MQIIVTGGAGFVGRTLVDRLVRRDWVDEVVVLDDGSGSDLSLLADLPVRLEAASVLDRDRLDQLTRRADALVHLAARWEPGAGLADPLGVHDVNATGTIRVLESAARNGVGHLVVCSCLHAGDASVTDPLAASFAAASAAVAGYRQGFGLRILELRLAEVVGAGRPVGHPRGGWLDAMVDAAVRGEPVPIRGDGRAPRAVVDVHTVADAVERALRSGVHAPVPVDVVGPTPATEAEVLAHLAERIGETLSVCAAAGADARVPDHPGPPADPHRITALLAGVAVHPLNETIDELLAERQSAALL